MKASGFALVVLVSLCAAAQAHAQASAGGAAPHVAAAKAAGQHANAARLFGTLCVPPPPIQAPQAAQPAPAQPPPPPARAQWYAEPVKVFDNLYWIGQTEYTSWAVVTSEGIIVIDPLFEYSVEEEVANGLTKLGLDPKRIRYVLVSHAHRDHVGGARFLQERFGARVVMSAADWNLLETDPGRWPKAKRDMVATDGQKLTLGDTTLTLYLTPGHTLGTISTIIPVKDGGRSHVAALWGGTGFNWRSGSPRYITPERPARFWYEIYSNSARTFREIAARDGADILLSNHPATDGSTSKLPAMAQRRPGQPHPYVIGNQSVSQFSDGCRGVRESRTALVNTHRLGAAGAFLTLAGTGITTYTFPVSVSTVVTSRRTAPFRLSTSVPAWKASTLFSGLFQS